MQRLHLRSDDDLPDLPGNCAELYKIAISRRDWQTGGRFCQRPQITQSVQRLNTANRQIDTMNKIEIYSWSWCPYCRAAKNLLEKKGLEYVEYDAEQQDIAQEMEQRAQQSSVPQIFINDKHIGGFDDLSELDADGELDELLNT